MTRSFFALLLFSGLSAQDQSTPADDGLESLTRLAGQALVHSRARLYLEELADGIGPRLTGSPEEAKALEWAERTMQAIGLSHVHRDRWKLQRSWRRVAAQATLLKPFRLELIVASMGWAGSTPKGGVEADVVEVDSDSISNEVQRNASRWSGKVLLVVAKGAQHLGSIEYLSKLPALLQAAHAAHAAAVIIEDPRPGTLLPHTGINSGPI